MDECNYAGCDRLTECEVKLPQKFVRIGEGQVKDYCADHAEGAIEDIPGAEKHD